MPVMYHFTNHFLDANILVGSRLPLDTQYDRSSHYLSLPELKRCTSNHAYFEAKGVLQNRRRLALRYLKELYENPLPDASNINRNMRIFNEDFTAALEDSEKRIIYTFFDNYKDLIKKIALGSISHYDALKQDTIDEIKSALNALDIDCNSDVSALIYRFDSCPDRYILYFDEEAKLMSTINYKNDVQILLDAYYIKNSHIRSQICFITTDREHILNNKPNIEEILRGMCIQPPRFPCVGCFCSESHPIVSFQ